MEAYFAIAFGFIISTSVYLMLSRNVLRIVLGFLLLSNGINLSLFICGRLVSVRPPLLGTLPGNGSEFVAPMANPLPQALILTAIVISFALTMFAVALFQRAYRSMGVLDTEQMRVVEPRVNTGAKVKDV